MGSYNVACSISHITICPGMPVAYFILKPAKYRYDIEAKNNTLIYPYCYYAPAALPIFGEYFDYGMLQPIKKDDNTKAIEKFTGHSIEGIVNNEGKAGGHGMFVHRDIYKTMIVEQVDEWGSRKPRAFGGVSRYSLNKKYAEYREALMELQKKIKAAKKRLKKGGYSGAFECELTMAQYEIKDKVMWAHNWSDETFEKTYAPYIQQGKLRKQLVDFMLFYYSMWYANAHFFPAANGVQFGNHYGNRTLHEKALEILNVTIAADEKERAKWDEKA